MSYEFKVTLLNFGEFTFGQEGTMATLSLKDDVTAIESANISILLSQGAASIHSSVSYAWIDFIKDKKIERHFLITQPK